MNADAVMSADGQTVFEFPGDSVRERQYREWRRTDDGQKVFALFERFALELADTGRRFGFKAVGERVRWEVKTTWANSDDYKVNNTFIALIAREVAQRHPRIKPLVEFRERRREHREVGA